MIVRGWGRISEIQRFIVLSQMFVYRKRIREHAQKLWCKRSFAPFYKHYIKCEDTKDFQKRIDYNVTNGVVFLERSIEMCPLDVYAFRNEICPHSTYCDTCGRELHYIPLEWAKSKLVNGVSFHYYMIYTCLHWIECNLPQHA